MARLLLFPLPTIFSLQRSINSLEYLSFMLTFDTRLIPKEGVEIQINENWKEKVTIPACISVIRHQLSVPIAKQILFGKIITCQSAIDEKIVQSLYGCEKELQDILTAYQKNYGHTGVKKGPIFQTKFNMQYELVNKLKSYMNPSSSFKLDYPKL